MTRAEAFKILKISAKANREEVKQGFHVLANIYHPDKNPQSKRHIAKYKYSQIVEAYNILKDAQNDYQSAA